MKFLKGCCSIILLVLIVLLLTTMATLSSVTSVVFSPRIPNRVIDNLNFDEIIAKGSDEVGKKIEETPADPAGEGTSFDSADFEQTVSEVADSVTEEDEIVVKSTLKEVVSEGLSFLTDYRKKEIRIDVSQTKQILFRIILDTDEFRERLSLPLPFCDEVPSGNCLETEDVAKLLDKKLTGQLTKADIEEYLPICENNDSDQEDCIAQERVDELVDVGNTQNEEVETENPFAEVFKNDEILISESQFDDGFVTVRSVLSRINLGLSIGIFVTILLSGLILLMKKINGLYYLASGLIFVAILLVIPALLIYIQKSWLIDLADSRLSIRDNVFYDEALNVFNQYTSALSGAFLLRAGICLVLGAGLIVLGYYLKNRNKKV